MAKGSRSKIKRANRTEFRRTIGEVAASKNRDIIQAKLKECMEKGSMNSFERLSNVLQTSQDETEKGNDSPNVLPVDAMDTVMDESQAKMEDKIPAKKNKKKKYGLKGKKPSADQRKKPERRKPKFFCEF